MLWPAVKPDFKRELRSMVTWWEGQLKDLRTSHAVKAIDDDGVLTDGPDGEVRIPAV